MRRACSRRAVHINVPARSLPAGPPSFPSPSPPLPAARACSAPLPHASVQVLIHAADGTLLQRFRPCEHALGVKCFAWSPTAHLLALASARDLRVRLLNSLTWQRVAEFDLGAGELTEHRTADAGATARPPPLPPSSPCPPLPSPIRPHTPGRTSSALLSPSHTSTAAQPPALSLSLSLPTNLDPRLPPATAVPPAVRDQSGVDDESPTGGVGLLSFSASGLYLASRNDLVADRLWVHDTRGLGLHAVLPQPAAVSSAGARQNSKRVAPPPALSHFHPRPTHRLRPASTAWHPFEDVLALCCGTPNVSLWSPKGSCAAAASFRISSLEWSPAGDRLILMGEEKCCVAAWPFDSSTRRAEGLEASKSCA